MEKTRVFVSNVYLVDMATKEETRVHAEMTFGRAGVEKNFPQDTLISRKHFRIIPADDVVLIEDLGSTNRTKVNGKLLKASTLYKLKSRDVIEFGQQKFQVFIGGKIADEKTVKTAAKKPERSLVFEREMPEGEGVLAGLEIERDPAMAAQSQTEIAKDDAILESLVQKKNAGWYLQFSGSEFGPLSLKELKTMVQTKQFQGGALFAFTEGLADWLPIEKLGRFLGEATPEFTATRSIAAGTPMVGTVACLLRGDPPVRVEGRLEAITLTELTVLLKEPLSVGTMLFEVEVNPDKRHGVEPFKASVRLDSDRSVKNKYVLVMVQATPRAKMEIERFLRGKG